ncbi:MAG TPA: LssY C-terminal domain-containing protein [Edaphobacter sp.]|nr:LssY C-terminal domain-containing protein [Edaphobacter sp.]
MVILLAGMTAGGGLAGQTASAPVPAGAQDEPAAPVASGPIAAGAIAAGPKVEAIASMRDHGGAVAGPKHKDSYGFTVKDGEWMDTGVAVAAGEQVNFSATGSFTLSDGRVAGPDGLDRGWKDLLRQFPLNQAKTSALVGRVSDVGASIPFSIGADGEVTMPTSGRLFLRVNVASDLTATGAFKVKMKFVQAKAAAAAVASAGPTVSERVTPGTFSQVPRRVADQAGDEGDMVNYALVGSEGQVLEAFKAAGWVAVDKTVQDAVLHGLMATLSHDAYTEMPMSTLYLFGRAQDLSFARGDPLMVAAERHHLRVWETTQTVDGRPLWVGSATHDVGFEKDQRNGQVTHKIDPKIDGERDFLLQSFDAAGVFSSAAYVTPVNPMLQARTATGGSFFSDGRILVMDLK